MTTTLLWTSGDLEALADDGKRYEIIDGELYSRRGVHEYWIIDWRTRQMEIHRRDEAQLKLIATLYEPDTLTTRLLEGFTCRVAELFEGIPSAKSSDQPSERTRD